jgi:hypothetical protein
LNFILNCCIEYLRLMFYLVTIVYLDMSFMSTVLYVYVDDFKDWFQICDTCTRYTEDNKLIDWLIDVTDHEILQTKLNHNHITNVNLLTVIGRLLYLIQTCIAQNHTKKLKCTNTMKCRQTKLFLSFFLQCIPWHQLLKSHNYYTTGPFISSPFMSLSN